MAAEINVHPFKTNRPPEPFEYVARPDPTLPRCLDCGCLADDPIHTVFIPDPTPVAQPDATPPPLTEALRAQALSALRGILNPFAHTDSCFELRGIGVRNCTKACARIRQAVEALSGVAPPNPNWPFGTAGQELTLELGHAENYLEGGTGQNGTSR